MLYRTIRVILRYIFLFFGLKLQGIHNLPDKGPVIIAANHVSNWDPLIIAVAIERPVHYMAKSELFNNILLGKLLYKVNAFPVKRGAADRKAIKNALDILRQGEILGMFPEGTRNKTGEEIKLQLGVAMLVLKAKAPVVPVACLGTNRKFPIGWFKPLVVRIGKPLNIHKYEGQKIKTSTMEELSVQIKEEINSLLYK